MSITVNGECFEIVPETTLYQWLEARNINPATVIVEYNGNILARENWSDTVLKDKDSIEILQFMGGG